MYTVCGKLFIAIKQIPHVLKNVDHVLENMLILYTQDVKRVYKNVLDI